MKYKKGTQKERRGEIRETWKKGNHASGLGPLTLITFSFFVLLNGSNYATNKVHWGATQAGHARF